MADLPFCYQQSQDLRGFWGSKLTEGRPAWGYGRAGRSGPVALAPQPPALAGPIPQPSP